MSNGALEVSAKEMSRIIILTQYYPPETGALQNRLHSLAKFLKGKGFDVQVVPALHHGMKSLIYSVSISSDGLANRDGEVIIKRMKSQLGDVHFTLNAF